MRQRLRLVVFAAAVPVLLVAGVLGAAGLAGATRAATPLDGQWRGLHLYSISGSLEGGFTVSAAESYMATAKCSVSSGTKLGQLTPIGGGKYSELFGVLWSDCTRDPFGERAPETVTVTLSGNTLTISGCGLGFCDAMTRVGAAPPTTTATKPTTTTTAPTEPKPPQKKDTSPPVVDAIPKGLTKPGTRDSLLFTVKDDSGRATAHATLYEGGKPIKSAVGPVANGQRRWKEVLFAKNLVGPLFFCVWAEDAAGHKSARYPHSSCAWIKLRVPIERVSNGCGGRGWDALEKVQQYFGNEHTFFDFGSGLKYTVNFKDACDLHDAGYGGHIVLNKLRGGTIDYRNWSRLEVDRRFRRDLRLLCHSQIPESAEGAMAKCVAGASVFKNVSVAAQVGADTLYDIVSTFGDLFFDSDLVKPGHQSDSEKSSRRDIFDFR